MKFEYRQLTYVELMQLLSPTGATSKDSISISNIDTKATLTFYCAGSVLPSLLYTLIGDTLGGYEFGTASYGKMKRIPPLAHPYFPWLYCTDVPEITGQAYVNSISWQGQNENLVNIGARDLKQSTAPLWNNYREYIVKANFSQRPYSIYTDDEVIPDEALGIDYYSARNTTDDPDFPGVNVWDEWNRFCVVEYDIEGQFLSAQQGQFQMISTVPNAVSARSALPGNIRQFRPGASIKYKWFAIPYEWVTGPKTQIVNGPPRGFSVLDYAQGTINQHPFDGWAEGTLLYTGVKVVNIYNRPYPSITQFNTISSQRLCDVELNFTYRDPRRRFEDENPDKGLKQHGSYIPRGNNTVPNARDGYNYPVVYVSEGVDPAIKASPVISKTNGGQGIYQSFPHQFLFQDPSYIYETIGGFLV
jgi:hypothetical protein